MHANEEVKQMKKERIDGELRKITFSHVHKYANFLLRAQILFCLEN